MTSKNKRSIIYQEPNFQSMVILHETFSTVFPTNKVFTNIQKKKNDCCKSNRFLLLCSDSIISYKMHKNDMFKILVYTRSLV